MSVFHHKAELIEQDHQKARYRFYLDFVEREDLYGVAVVEKPSLHFNIEIRSYGLTERLRQKETKSLSALRHKLKKAMRSSGEWPSEVYHVA